MVHSLTLTIIVVIAVVHIQWATSFTPSSLISINIVERNQISSNRLVQSNRCKERNNRLFVEHKNDDEAKPADVTDSSSNVSAALPPSLPSVVEMGKEKEADTASVAEIDIVPTSTTALLINQQTKRVLIEELGYKRSEVEKLRPEFSGPIVSKRISRPKEGVPEEWILPEEERTDSMLQKLEQEQKYPLKVPLLGISLILFGKGFGDALITLIKVYIDFPGSDLLIKEQFMGLPVLGIDFVCVVLGASIGYWTWNNMKN